MPLQNFRPAPGINKEVTDYTGQGKWTDGDMVRFFQGSAQKIKGWAKFIATTIVGVARDQHGWVSLDGTRHNAVGTDRKLYVIQEGLAYDITPSASLPVSCKNICVAPSVKPDITSLLAVVVGK